VSGALREQVAALGVRDERVLAAIEAVPRALFVPEALRDEADADRPLPIGAGQTISQPFIVAFMTEGLGLGGGERVLEVGTGSGYQTAVLAALAREVFSIELLPELAERARALLHDRLGLRHVRLRVGDGRAGWPEAAPFDGIIVTAAPAEIPPALLAQLAPGGRLVIPVGAHPDAQRLLLCRRDADGRTTAQDLLGVRFVPLVAPGAPDA
jgi:protein-L-isoaspartate(D-aspartate) O-methyltransferase